MVWEVDPSDEVMAEVLPTTEDNATEVRIDEETMSDLEAITKVLLTIEDEATEV